MSDRRIKEFSNEDKHLLDFQGIEEYMNVRRNKK
jgi:hypothetical protein